MTRHAKAISSGIAAGTIVLASALHAREATAHDHARAVDRALAYLAREVRQWPQDKGCFSCHNSGDGVRTLSLARKLGHDVDADATAETIRFLRQPAKWHEAGEDEPFKDKKLATIQFAAALLGTIDAGIVEDRTPLVVAAAQLAEFQAEDGAWHVDQTGFGGSPVTWGAALATAMSRRVLVEADSDRFAAQIAAADRWLRSSESKRIVDASGILLGLAKADDAAAERQRARCVDVLKAAQQASGGWGLFANRQTEAFDTAIAIIALASLGEEHDAAEAIRRGCDYLTATQAEEGSWEETTRPAGWESYAHRVSTTAWATMALSQAGGRSEGS